MSSYLFPQPKITSRNMKKTYIARYIQFFPQKIHISFLCYIIPIYTYKYSRGQINWNDRPLSAKSSLLSSNRN